MTDYQAAIDWLYGLQVFGTKMGLDKTRRLMDLLGNPQNNLRFIHVAGTNGKGSVIAFLESICRHAGYRTGMFSSPHLVRFGERIQVNRALISEKDIIRLVSIVKAEMHAFDPSEHPTFFEVTVAMALLYFRENSCDIVLWETGLGGRLDATNIVTPLVSVITSISMDHQQWLGNSPKEIAFEKAGIIKPGVPVVAAFSGPDVSDVLSQRSRSLVSPLEIIGREEAMRVIPHNTKPGLRGDHQILNAALAASTVRKLRSELAVCEDSIKQGLIQTQLPGRFQALSLAEGNSTIIDVAHNPAAIEQLIQELKGYFGLNKPVWLFGIMADKEWKPVLDRIAGFAAQIILIQPATGRALSKRIMQDYLVQMHSRIPVQLADGFADAIQGLSKCRHAVVSGSFYVLGEFMQTLETQGDSINEIPLNAWNASAK